MASANPIQNPTTTATQFATEADDLLFETVVGAEIISALAKADKLLAAAQQITGAAAGKEQGIDYIALGGIDFLIESAQALVLASLRGIQDSESAGATISASESKRATLHHLDSSSGKAKPKQTRA
ncbi:hypothetical protein [Pseudomonas oryzihabitans]|uniref:hypothetical protein n=1 Tax=Pseudomonas oryzihabitans TaxID=47885 RepID=UPI00241DCCD6|nr:hypothetical protein [Pseudomonas oryzihabitans]